MTLESYYRQFSQLQQWLRVYIFLKIILFSIFVIFNNFHKQHKCNNRLTNNSINNCSFCFLFTPSFLKVFPSVDVMLEPKKNSRHQGSTSQPMAQHTEVHCSRVWRPLGYPGAQHTLGTYFCKKRLSLKRPNVLNAETTPLIKRLQV